MRTGRSAGTLAVLSMWAPEPRPSPGSSSCRDKRHRQPPGPWQLGEGGRRVVKHRFLIVKTLPATGLPSLHPKCSLAPFKVFFPT